MRSNISGWWYLLPLTILLSVFGISAVEMSSISNRNYDAAMASYPSVTADELDSRLNLVKKSVKNDEARNPNDYYRFLGEIRLIQLGYEKLIHSDEVNDTYNTRIKRMSLGDLQNDLVSQQSRLGILKISTPERDKLITDHGLNKRYDLEKENVLAPFGWAYMITVFFIAPIFFMFRLRREDLMVRTEMFRITIWSVVWPAGIFKYPVGITRTEQFQQFRRWISALVSMLLGMSPVAMAHAKSGGGKLGSVEVVQVEQQGPTIRTIEPPPPQILPTLVVDNVTFNFSGWAHVQASSNDGPELTMLKTRFIVTDPGSNIQIFSQLDLLRKEQPIDELWVGYGDSDLKVKVGHLFRGSAFSAPAPFLMETITAPRLPVSFFGTGVAIEGAANDNLSFTVDVTGDSRAAPFSGQMFERVDISGSLKQVHSGGFIRLSAQHIDDLRIVMDGQHQFGPHRVRAAVHYRTDGDKFGGYVFLSRDLSDIVRVFTQFELENDRLRLLAGLLYAVNDNFNLTIEASRDDEWRLRARGRF